MALAEVFRHPLFIALASGLFGVIVAGAVFRIRNRMARIVYHASMIPIGISSVDPVFGTIRVSWNKKDLNNLFLIKIVIENSSSRDISNLHLKVYVDDESRVLGERSSIAGTSFVLPWSQEFRDQIAIQLGASPTDGQTYIYCHNREYRIDALNRFQRAEIDLLCTRLTTASHPNAFLETKSEGVRIRRIPPPVAMRSSILGVPIRRASPIGLLMTAMVAVVCVLFVSPVWMAVAIPTVVGLFGQLVGAATLRAMRAIRVFLLR